MERFFDISFWLSPNPAPLSFASLIALLVFANSLLVFALLNRVKFLRNRTNWEKPRRQLYKKEQGFLVICALLLNAWSLIAYEGIRFFSGRFWLAAIFFLGIVWAVTIARFARWELPRRLAEIDQRKNLLKYLPKKK